MIEDAVRELRSRISSRSFRKAVGSSVVRHIEELLNFVESRIKGCTVTIPRDEVERLIDDYYVVESRVKALVRELVEVQGGVGLVERLARLYPILPPALREVLSRVMDRALGPEEPGGAVVEDLVREILRGLGEFRERLVRLLEMYSSRACSQSSSETPSSP